MGNYCVWFQVEFRELGLAARQTWRFWLAVLDMMLRPFVSWILAAQNDRSCRHRWTPQNTITVTVNYCQYVWVRVSLCSKLPCLWTRPVARPRISWDQNGLGQVMSHWLLVDISWLWLWLIMLCLCEPCHPILRISKCLDGIGCCMMARYFSSLNWNHSCLLEGWPPKQVSCVWAEDSFERGLLGFADLCLGACHPKSWTGDPLLWHPSKLSSWRWSGISQSSQRMKPFKMTEVGHRLKRNKTDKLSGVFLGTLKMNNPHVGVNNRKDRKVAILSNQWDSSRFIAFLSPSIPNTALPFALWSHEGSLEQVHCGMHRLDSCRLLCRLYSQTTFHIVSSYKWIPVSDQESSFTT